jgi:hypothetical protein
MWSEEAAEKLSRPPAPHRCINHLQACRAGAFARLLSFSATPEARATRACDQPVRGNPENGRPAEASEPGELLLGPAASLPHSRNATWTEPPCAACGSLKPPFARQAPSRKPITTLSNYFSPIPPTTSRTRTHETFHPAANLIAESNQLSSELKSETARINGAKSHGPVTPEGKARSSANSRRHGLTASALLEGESDEHFQLLLADFMDHFQPQTGVEADLVEVMAIARWRLRRLLAIEAHLFDLEIIYHDDQIKSRSKLKPMEQEDRMAFAFQKLGDNGNSLTLLLRYEGSLNRSYDKALKQLLQLQSNRPPRGPLGSFRISEQTDRPSAPGGVTPTAPAVENLTSARQTVNPSLGLPMSQECGRPPGFGQRGSAPTALRIDYIGLSVRRTVAAAVQ